MNLHIVAIRSIAVVGRLDRRLAANRAYVPLIELHAGGAVWKRRPNSHALRTPDRDINGAIADPSVERLGSRWPALEVWCITRYRPLRPDEGS